MIFRDGPTNTFTGSDWINILTSVAQELNSWCIAKKIEPIYTGYYSCLVQTREDVRVSMLGHSRGGHVIMNLAGKLNTRTHFMGLYDAVNRTADSDGDFDGKIRNTNFIAHAIRDSSVGSRTLFDNTGLGSDDNGVYIEKRFKTSHGGVGGDVLYNKMIPMPWDDSSTDISFWHHSDEDVAKAVLAMEESYSANYFIVNEAKKRGLKYA